MIHGNIIHSGKRSSPRRVLCYGIHGIGKSTFASMTPSPIFIPTEDGLGDIDCQSFELCKTFDEVIGFIGWLYEQPHDYKTCAIDSLDWLERLILADVCRLKNCDNIEDIGYGKGYVFALSQWRVLLDGLDALRRDRGMAIVLLAHAKIEKFDNPETDSYDRYSPQLHKLASHLIQQWCDEVLFANYKVFTTKTDEGFNRKKFKGAGNGERVLYTTERPAHVAKNRLGLPDEIPLNWREYAKYLNPG